MSDGEWVLGNEIGRGGFGKVYSASQGELDGAVKFIPKAKGTPRELLLEIPDQARNVVHVTGIGEDEDHWIVSMPLAERSLGSLLDEYSGPLPEKIALDVLVDVADALIDLESKIVHRDIKPENILLIDGKWCLCDFGIARYADAATGTQTHKGYGSEEYTAPELWRGGRASSRSDMYALGVVAYEMVAGHLPFTGSSQEIYQGHLNETPSTTGAPKRLDWAILDCLKKAPNLRLTAAQFRDKLEPSVAATLSAGALALGEADQAYTQALDLAEMAALKEAEEEKIRQEHLQFAQEKLARISQEMLERLVGLAPRVQVREKDLGAWQLALASATIDFSPMAGQNSYLLAEEGDPFSVLARASIRVWQGPGITGHVGRSHALWYSDAKEAGNFHWYETAFIQNGGLVPTHRDVPFDAAFESREATMAVRRTGQYLVAWPFTLVDADDLDEFIDRWALWFAQASEGKLTQDVRPDIVRAEKSWREA
ncbi:serine/threonine-protein kinase [Arthrobacter sp. D2-10]